MTVQNRRPSWLRSLPIVQRAAAWLAQRPAVTADRISVTGAICAGLAAMFLMRPVVAADYLVAAVFIGARMVCGVLDGLVAIEHKKRTPSGPLYNEFMDRIADTLIILGVGYSIQLPGTGWAGAFLAAMTAFIRVYGSAQGIPQDFRGPMGKMHRMTLLGVGCLFAALEMTLLEESHLLPLFLLALVIGTLVTCYRRARALADALKLKGLVG